jgi:hypothetical protein
MKHIILFSLIASFAFAAEDGGLTGEQSITPPTAAQDAGISIRDMYRQFGQTCAATLQAAVTKITGGETTAEAATARAVAFWARVGTKGKRTLRWLNDLLAAADAAAPSGTDYVPQEARAALAKWTANPDNTVTVAP